MIENIVLKNQNVFRFKPNASIRRTFTFVIVHAAKQNFRNTHKFFLLARLHSVTNTL